MTGPVVSGTRIDRYRVEGPIGAGSMGDVYRGVDVDLGRPVAIKILSERHRDNDELRARFLREARAVARISHPNVVQVFTTGTFDDRPFIAMEFLDGIDLGSAIEQGGPYPSADAARAIRDAAHGLEAAARAGLIHRDVKPSNLVLLRDGTVKVTDFGLAKPLEPGEEPALTALGVVVGTPDYIAPEQARGERIDERVDIYALGGTLYFLLSGRPPFRTGNPAEDKYLKVVARHLREPPPDARAANPAADHELTALARTMMSKNPGRRPGYSELVGQLDALIRRLEEASGPVPRTVPAAVEGSGGRVAPTPFVGGGGLDSADVARAATEADEDDPDDSAPTNIRIPTRPPVSGAEPGTRDSGPAVARPRVAKWLVAITVFSALLFACGLGLLLFGPMPAGEAAVPRDAAASVPADAPPPPPAEPPEGMLLVPPAGDAPGFFVDATPVTHGEFAALFPNRKKPSPRRNDRAVTDVRLEYARAYADARDKRLLTAAEWRRADQVEGFETRGKAWEWVAPAGERPTVVRTGSEPRPRKDRGYRDVTFRLARDRP